MSLHVEIRFSGSKGTGEHTLTDTQTNISQITKDRRPMKLYFFYVFLFIDSLMQTSIRSKQR